VLLHNFENQSQFYKTLFGIVGWEAEDLLEQLGFLNQNQSSRE